MVIFISEISSEHIYANNYMNLDDVHTIGFDLDYTLVLYKGVGTFYSSLKVLIPVF